MDWRAAAQAKREAINGLIPQQWRLANIPTASEQKDVTGNYIQEFLTPQEIEITESDAVGILEHTTTGKWKATDVMAAFCHRAALAHQLVNCLLEIFFDEGMKQAQDLDKYFATNGRPIGPLHGLPISLKDQFHVTGQETTMGYVGWIGTFQGRKGTDKERNFESELARELRYMGAAFYCKTSVPHTLMCGETINNIIGYTSNPKNRFLSSGGSSGGEGALLSLRGSPLGFGTDIGGSIRIPATFCGLYGLRPSHGRLPYEGMANSMDGQNSILSVVGPLAHSARDLKMIVKAVLGKQPWLHDPLVNEIPWRRDQEEQIIKLSQRSSGGSGGLCFGLLNHDGYVMPHPPVRRALDIVTRAVEKMGHKVITWDPPSHKRGGTIAYNSWYPDEGEDARSAARLSGEPFAKQVLGPFQHPRTEQKNAIQIAENNVRKREYQKEYLEYWNSTTIQTGTGRPADAFIMPLAPFAAAIPENYTHYDYSSIINLLDYTASAIPVVVADKSVDVSDTNYRPMNETDRATWEQYDPELFDGSYVGIQIVGRRQQEEKIIALTEMVQHALIADKTPVSAL